jgi:hypothetical protein
MIALTTTICKQMIALTTTICKQMIALTTTICKQMIAVTTTWARSSAVEFMPINAINTYYYLSYEFAS